MTYSALSHLVCSRTGTRYDADRVQGVSEVGAPLLVEYDLDQARRTMTREGITARPPTLWRYHEMLPVRDPAKVVSLGEGMTPLLVLRCYGARVGLRSDRRGIPRRRRGEQTVPGRPHGRVRHHRDRLAAGSIGQTRKRDQETSWIRFTPRRPRSSWSHRNIAHVARLETQGRMLPPGGAAVDAAKADGRWATAYAPPSEAEAPADLLAAITAVPAAQAMFDVLTKTNRFALIYRVNAVKQAQTRERKIGEFVAMLARHETIHPQRAKPPSSP